MNALISLEVTSCSWSVIATKGDVPCPRSYHAANRYRNLMLVHGGESKQERPHAHSQVMFDLGDGQSTEMSRSVSMSAADETVGVQGATHSQSTSVINIPALQERHAPAHMGHDGVTLGDSLCGTKLAGQIKVYSCLCISFMLHWVCTCTSTMALIHSFLSIYKSNTIILFTCNVSLDIQERRQGIARGCTRPCRHRHWC